MIPPRSLQPPLAPRRFEPGARRRALTRTGALAAIRAAAARRAFATCRALAAGHALIASTACSGDAHTLGSLRADDEPSEPFYVSDAGFLGRWLGQASEPLAFGVEYDEDAPIYAFPSGSTRIELLLAARTVASGRAVLDGTLTFGDGDPPSPATDAKSGYPVGFDYDEFLSYGTGRSGAARTYQGMLPPLEGVHYVLDTNFAEAGVRDGVLEVSYDPASFLDPWCALQPPHPHDDGTFNVLPYAPGGIEVMADGTNRPCSGFGPNDLSGCPEDMDLLPRDEYVATYRACSKPGAALYQMSCDRMYLSRFCSCTADGCRLAEPPERARLLLRARGDALIGAFSNARFLNARGLPGPIGEVRFTRQRR